MLDRCQAVYGDTTFVEDDPSILQFENVLYVPFGFGEPPGVYDSGRKLIPTTGYWRGPELLCTGEFISKHRFSDFIPESGRETFFYCGHMHQHFGHFLLSTFSRFWPFVDPEARRSLRIVMHTQLGVAEYMSLHREAATLLRALGLAEENFVTFKQLTRIRRLLVVAPSFEETSFAHSAFARLGNKVGETLCSSIPTRKRLPAWLSKERLAKGVRRVVNESEVTALLASRGVDIIYPETLNLHEQAAFWRDTPACAGFVGSAFHVGILAPGRAIVGISDSLSVSSNFVLADKANTTSAIYLGVREHDMEDVPAQATPFDTLKRIYDPANYAESVLAALDELR